MDAPSTNPKRRGWFTAVAIAILLAGGGVLAAEGRVASGSDGGTGATHSSQRARSANPYRGDGMWIWYVSRASGGDLDRIARKARRNGIETVYVKSSDGRTSWSQFRRGLVSYLHARGLRVCAWQFVYGTHPSAEARRGAEAVRKGADCLVIDAESNYEGRYAAADTYVDKLRREIGDSFPTALTSFPFVDYHPGFPYSVFLGPGGARYNLPQLYWHTIGATVGEGYQHTFRFNRVYRRGMYPLGQTYDDPPIRQIRRFRRMAISYELGGLSWWSWQHTSRREWRAVGRHVKAIPGAGRSDSGYPVLAKGSRGDLVVWAQEHLKRSDESLPVTGYFGRQTRRAVRRFQRSKGQADDGRIRPQTWRALLDVAPRMVDWSSRSARGAGKHPAAAPRSAALPALRDEIPPPSHR